LDKKLPEGMTIKGLDGVILKIDFKEGVFVAAITDGTGTKEIKIAPNNNDSLVDNALYDLYRAGCDARDY